jgi:hypothetical protein
LGNRRIASKKERLVNRTKTKIFGIAALAAASVVGYFVWQNRHKPIPPPAGS